MTFTPEAGKALHLLDSKEMTYLINPVSQRLSTGLLVSNA